jgi:hypothetical protein
MPNDLLEMYDSTLERNCKQSERDRELATTVVAWISRARHPLAVDELRNALTIEYITHEKDLPRKSDLTDSFVQSI